MQALRTLLVLGRVSNLPTVWTNAAVGWFLSGGGWTTELAWLIAGISLLYIAGMTLNDAFDAEWDRQHAPDRPIPSGRISLKAVWLIGWLQKITGVALLAMLTSAHLLVVGALFLAVQIYNVFHKRWKGSVLFMGLCRALVYVVAASAVPDQTDSLVVPGIVIALAVGAVLHVAGITLAARSEHLGTPTGLPFPRRILLTLPVLYPLLAFRFVPSTPLWIAVSAVGALAIWTWLVIARRAMIESVPRGVAFSIAGIAFYDAAVLAFADWRAAVAAALCFGLALVAQRMIPAT